MWLYTPNPGTAITWTPETAAARHIWYSLSYADALGLFVATGSACSIMTSSDGITWASQTGPGGFNKDMYTAWSPTLQILASISGGASDNQAMSSTNATLWTSRVKNNVQAYKAICWGNDRFVAVGDSGATRAQYSTNGTSWNAGTPDATHAWCGVVYSPQLLLFCAVALDGYTTTSTDGITWTAAVSASPSWRSVCWADTLGLFCAVGNGFVSTSPDGTTWTSRTSANAHSWYAVTFGHKKQLFVAVGDPTTTGTDCCMTSNNGVNWVTQTTPAISAFDAIVSAENLASKGRFCAVADDHSTNAQVMISDS